MALSPLLPCLAQALFTHSQTHLLKITQQTSVPCDTADMSAVGQGGHVCCVTQQTCLPWPTVDKSAGWHSRHVCRVTWEACLSCDAAGMSAVTQQKCLL